MKYIKTYEGLRDSMKPIDNDTLLKKLEKLDNSDKIKLIIKYQLPFDLLPSEKLIVNSDIILPDNVSKLPDNLTVNGMLYCYGCSLTHLPENLTVNGNLSCDNNKIKKIPDNLKVNGNFSCCFNYISKLPDNLTIDGDFTCSYNLLTYLPENLTINGDFECTNNPIKLELPESAKIKGEFKN